MDSHEEVIRFSVSLPRRLLEELDSRVVGRGYASRSEFVRDLIRQRIAESQWEDEGQEVVGVLAIVYDHHQRQLTERILHVQHHWHVNILCSTHVHLDHRHCLETIIVRGRPPEIEKISLEIGGLRGVRLAGVLRASETGE
jgi:CopG family nickel-responsive transcriptional regulator